MKKRTVTVTVANIHWALAKQFPWSIPFKSKEDTARQFYPIPFPREENRTLDNLWNMPKLTRLVNARPRIRSWAEYIHRLVSKFS